MTEAVRYQILKFEPPHGLQDSIIASMASLHATKVVDERGRVSHQYQETELIGEYTDSVLKMDSAINEFIGKEGLELCPLQKQPMAIRTGDKPNDFHFVDSDHVAIMSPLSHDKVPVWVAAKGDAFIPESSVTGTKQDLFITLPDTQFFITAPHYVMVRPIRRI